MVPRKSTGEVVLFEGSQHMISLTSSEVRSTHVSITDSGVTGFHQYNKHGRHLQVILSKILAIEYKLD